MATERKKQIVDDYKIRDGDTGSPEVQVALLTEKIQSLTEHLKVHKKDFISRRGLLMMVGRRSTLLKYLERTDRDRHRTLKDRLNLR